MPHVTVPDRSAARSFVWCRADGRRARQLLPPRRRAPARRRCPRARPVRARHLRGRPRPRRAPLPRLRERHDHEPRRAARRGRLRPVRVVVRRRRGAAVRGRLVRLGRRQRRPPSLPLAAQSRARAVPRRASGHPRPREPRQRLDAACGPPRPRRRVRGDGGCGARARRRGRREHGRAELRLPLDGARVREDHRLLREPELRPAEPKRPERLQQRSVVLARPPCQVDPSGITCTRPAGSPRTAIARRRDVGVPRRRAGPVATRCASPSPCARRPGERGGPPRRAAAARRPSRRAPVPARGRSGAPPGRA